MKIPDIFFDVFSETKSPRGSFERYSTSFKWPGVGAAEEGKKSPEEGFFHVSFCCSFCTARCNYSRVKWTLMFSHSKFLFSSSPSRLQSTFCAFAADVIIAQKKQIVQNYVGKINHSSHVRLHNLHILDKTFTVIFKQRGYTCRFLRHNNIFSDTFFSIGIFLFLQVTTQKS